jgi:pyruvate dehydrogenase E1 component alpha subunit
MALSLEELKTGYYNMVLAREFERKCEALFQQGIIRGSLHMCIGQEATAAGTALALRDDDILITNYRGHGHALAKGISPRAAMAEMLGKVTGCCKGKGGSMHWTDLSKGIMPANAIVGAGLPTVVGCALAAKLDGNDNVAVTFFGDGATNQGVVHEAMNLAAMWQAPAIFICENNLYSEMTPISQTTNNKDLVERAAAYNIPAEIVDGNDIEAMHDAVCRAVTRGRQGKGPTFIEAKTYRTVGHMIGDSQIYRDKADVEAWRAPERDPIMRLGAKLLGHGLTASQLTAIEQEVTRVIEDAVQFAKDSPYPALDEVYVDVFEHRIA